MSAAPQVLHYELPVTLSTTFRNPKGRGNLIIFDPSNVQQRYMATTTILRDPRWNYTFKKVVNFARGELDLLPYLRKIDTIEHILEVGSDKNSLQKFKLGAEPSRSDYINQRELPLRIEVLYGSIEDRVEPLQNVDAVIALEVMEHFKLENLENLSKNIFGFVKPKLAIISTPNREFNVLFESGLADNNLRKPNHKFEMTRKKFKNWALGICRTYYNYNVYIVGVGKPLSERPDVGHATQIAIFERIDNRKKPLQTKKKQVKKNKRNLIKREISANSNPDVQYKRIYVADFPFATDTRNLEQKIMDTLEMYRRNKLYLNKSRRLHQIPITIFKFRALIGDAYDTQLRDILLKNNNEVEGDYIISPEV